MIRTKRTPHVKMIADINITPFTDVCLVLLIIFMVTATSLVKESGLKMTLPKSSEKAELPTSITVRIMPSRKMFFNNTPVATFAELQGLIKASHEKYGTQLLVVKADETVPYQLVVTTIDCARQVGVHDFALATRQTD